MRFHYLASATSLTIGVSALQIRDTIADPSFKAITSRSPDYFDYEKLQLADADLADLDPTLRALFAFNTVNSTNITNTTGCKTFPGDDLWPDEFAWDRFDTSLGGALIKTIPIAAPCYKGPHYDAARCAYVTDNWSNSSMHELDPTSMMSPIYQGLTCVPSINATGTCTLGGYPIYAVNITTVAQIQLAVNFARNTNIRLVIKNTGHDFSGKSGGAGALSIWTHYLNDIEYDPSYVDETLGYSGPAFKAGSGVIARDIYDAAAAQNMMVVGGEGATVGVMGGWVQGGGHSPMSSLYGLGADQVLNYEVVTADGRFVTVSPSQNTDLFWALRGGGGSTFGVLTSVTVKAYPTLPVTAVFFSFAPSATVSEDTFWAGVRAYFDYFITFTEAGVYSYFWVFPGPVFSMQPFWAPNMTTAETAALLKPWLDRLAALGVKVTPEYTTYSNFRDGWSAAFPQEVAGKGNDIVGSRLFPKENWQNETLLNATFAAWKSSADLGWVLISFNIRAPNVAGVDDAVLPAWRDTVMHAIESASWPEGSNATTIRAVRAQLSAQQILWSDVSPNSGAYLGECDINDPYWQKNFFGKNYPRLLEIKHRVDPKNVFWARTGVGSEVLAVQTTDVISDENGKLCYV